MSCLDDLIPNLRRGRRRIYVLVAFNLLAFVMSVPFCTRVGEAQRVCRSNGIKNNKEYDFKFKLHFIYVELNNMVIQIFHAVRNTVVPASYERRIDRASQ